MNGRTTKNNRSLASFGGMAAATLRPSCKVKPSRARPSHAPEVSEEGSERVTELFEQFLHVQQEGLSTLQAMSSLEISDFSLSALEEELQRIISESHDVITSLCQRAQIRHPTNRGGEAEEYDDHYTYGEEDDDRNEDGDSDACDFPDSGSPAYIQPHPPTHPPPVHHSNTNVFAFHLPSDWTDESLIENFQGFGEILSAKVMLDGQRSRGFGFINFADACSAQAAIDAMNGKRVKGAEESKRLKVEFKKGVDSSSATRHDSSDKPWKSVRRGGRRGPNKRARQG